MIMKPKDDQHRPMAAACPNQTCPACGFPDLPSIEPETLCLRVGHNAVAGFPLPDGRMPVHAKGVIYLMTEEAWTAYKRLCANREMMMAQLVMEAHPREADGLAA